MTYAIIEHYGRDGPMRETDLDDINELNYRCFDGQKPMTQDYFARIFLANKMLIFVVARNPTTQRIVGKWSCYIIPRDNGEDDAIITWTEQVAVHTEHQRRGIARRLREKVAAIAKREKGIAHDNLSSSKESAQEAYLKMGYVKRDSQLFRRHYR